MGLVIQRLYRLGDLGGVAHLPADRLPKPAGGAHQLGLGLLLLRQPGEAYHEGVRGKLSAPPRRGLRYAPTFSYQLSAVRYRSRQGSPSEVESGKKKEPRGLRTEGLFDYLTAELSNHPASLAGQSAILNPRLPGR